jgi:NitT/TauT family transport system substrate-binding protein
VHVPRHIGVPLVLIAVLVVVAACGSSGDPGAGETHSAKSVTISLGELSSAVSHTPIFVAMQEGFFSRAGLDVSMQQLSGGTPAAMAALSTGSVNVMIAGANEFIEYSSRKVISGKIIGEYADATLDIVVAKGIGSIQQLKGRVLGIAGPNSVDQVHFDAVLRHHGLSENDVTFVTSGGPANRLTALSAGAVQAIAVSNSNREMSSKIGSVLLKSNDSPIQVPGGLFFASSDMIAKHKDELKRFIAALGAATAWVRANPEAAAADCAKGTGLALDACRSGITALTDRSANSKYTWSSTYAVNTDGIEAALAIEATLNPGTKGLAVVDLVDTSIAGTAP